MRRAFVCDHCGMKVSINASECPECHHIFKAVRCSRCGYSGQPKEFENGCPICHYFGGREEISTSRSSSVTRKVFKKKIKSHLGRKSQSSVSESVGLKTLILLLLGALLIIVGIYLFFGR